MTFRLLLPFEVIGELGIDAAHAQWSAGDARRHGDRFFAGERCCRRSSVQEPA